MKKQKLKTTESMKIHGVPLVVFAFGKNVALFQRVDGASSSKIELSISKNGVDFVKPDAKIDIYTISGKKEKIKYCSNFSISNTPNGFVMTYIRKIKPKDLPMLVVARSKDVFRWDVKSEIPAGDSVYSTVIYDKQKDKFEMYRDGLFIRNQASVSLSVWKDKPSLVFTSRMGQFDAGRIYIIGGTVTTDGILVLYDASVESGTKTLLQVGAAIFDPKNPKHVTWRSAVPVWQGVVDSKDKTRPIRHIGFANIGKEFLMYWITANRKVIIVRIPAMFRETEDAKHHPRILDRFESNPIIEPIHSNHWENEGTFNPAVVEDDEGLIHILYRAVGSDGISRIGYAKSLDGVSVDSRLPYPAYEPSRGYGMPDPGKVMGPLSYNPYIYTSGGGWGGSEDPRAVIIGNRLYMVYTAFEGWNSMRIALTSISLDDFKAGRWKWKKPVLISSPHNRSKNWLIFPEKINGKFAILHSISPKVLVDYVDDLDNFDDIIYSPRPEGPQPGRKDSWDFLLKGSGPPPIKTKKGWLLLYHALEKTDTGKYRLGAMLLDLKDPTKILCRSAHPILSPDMHYENDGKPGVVYASGALVKGKDLYVYYGGGDKVCCVAKTPLEKLLKYLSTGDADDYQLSEVKK